ncbi:MAG: tubulin-like doman-containing protein [Lachnospiraceae bacterium]|nr:tubulin-like doman-containing protein [Lachnospiraceae bacterium]
MLTGNQKERLARLSLEKGGVAFVNRGMHANPNPTLVVSLGGLGGDTLNMLKGKMLRQLGRPDNIHFLAIDADAANGLKSIKHSSSEQGYLDDDETFGLYRQGMSQILVDPTKRPEFTYSWMQNPFPQKVINDNGAQGIRQIGRIMLLCCGVYGELENKIRTIVNSMERPVTDLEIILIAGVSGGTGSGTIIDVSYLIRTLMDSMALTGAYSFSAYIFTPDVQFNESGIVGKPTIISNLQRNGYAAIKEIDYFMNLKNHKGVYSLDLGDGNPKTSSENIYDSCTIVTGRPAAGGMLSKKAVIDNLTENLLDLLTDITYEGEGGTVQMAKAFSSNKDGLLATWYDGVGSDPKMYPKAANYCYQVLGYSAVSIPRDEILAYCVNKMFRRVWEEFHNIVLVDQNYVVDVLQTANLTDLDSFATYALTLSIDEPVSKLETLPRDNWPNKRDLKDGTDSVLSDAQTYAREEADKIKDQRYFQLLKSEVLRALNGKIDAIFDSSGPYFVVELLTHKAKDAMSEDDPRKPFSGIIEQLNTMKDQAHDLSQSCAVADSSPQVRDNMQQLAEDATGFFAGRNEIQAYVDYCCRVAWKTSFMNDFYKTLEGVLGDVICDLTNTNNDIWGVYTDVLTEVSRLLAVDGAFVADAQKHDHVFSFDIINLYSGDQKTSQLRNYLDGLVSDLTVDRLCKAFIESMRKQRACWVEQQSMDNFKVVEEVRKIFDDVLSDQLKQDIMEKFMVVAYSPKQLTVEEVDEIWENADVQKKNALVKAAEEIKNTLDKNASLMANPRGGYAVSSFLDKKYIATLADTPNLSLELQNLYPADVCKARSNGLSKYIYSYIVYCVPLYLFTGFDEYDAVYSNAAANLKGLHMDEVGQNWKRFPQLYPLDLAAKDKKNYKQFYDYQILTEVKREAELAMNTYGFIKRDTNLQGTLNAEYSIYKIIEKPFDEEHQNGKEEFRQYVHKAVLKGVNNIFDIVTNEESGYVIEPELIQLDNNALNPLDLTGNDRYVPIGDFYKLIRMSIRYMDLLRDNLSLWEEAYKVLQDEKESNEGIAKYNLNFIKFFNALRTEQIGKVTDPKGNPQDVMFYFYKGKKEVLIDLRMEGKFDKTYLIYHAFRAFCQLPDSVIDYIERESTKTIQSLSFNPDVVLAPYVEDVDKVFDVDYGLNSMNAREEILIKTNSSRMDYKFRPDMNDDSDAYDSLRSFYQKLKDEF